MKFIKKSIMREAFQWTADQEQKEDPEWIVEAIKNGTVYFKNAGTEDVKMIIKTFGGNYMANRNDYIIQDINGELYPCKPDIFESIYEMIK